VELSEPLSVRVTLQKPGANGEKLKDAGCFTNHTLRSERRYTDLLRRMGLSN
jgi:hypothetical protein